jgi:putative transposase
MKTEGGDEALRRFRVSQPGANYFLTMKLADKGGPNLTAFANHAIRAEIEAIESSGHWQIRGAVIMPDHLHLLLTLGPTLPISRVVARLKSRTRTSCWRMDSAGRTTTTNTGFATMKTRAGFCCICFLIPIARG